MAALFALGAGRALLVILAFVSLAAGVAGGLARVTPLPVPISALALHGPLMVSAFFGTLISLERAASLGRAWAYAAPLCAAGSGLLLWLGFPYEGFVLMTLAAAVFFAASLVLLKRRAGLEAATRAGGALAWLLGNLSILVEFPAVPWWIAFFALTIGGERLEQWREPGPRPAARLAFLVIASAVFAAPLMPPFLGAMLVLLALWLFAFEPARAALSSPGPSRYAAACVLAGCFWLAAGGALIALELEYDAALHAIFLGFVLSVAFGHARVPYHPVLYFPLALLHASLAVRAAFSIEIGAWGNAAAIGLFIVTAAALVLMHQTRNRGRSPN